MEDLKTYSEKVLQTNFHVDLTTGCWLFSGNIRPNGYGVISYQMKNYSVHRLSAWIHLGLDLDSEEQVNHKPICPNRHCFNPEHIYVGNQSQNLHDYYGPIEERVCPTCKSKMTEDNVYVYKSKTRKVYKWCKWCRKLSRKRQWRHHRI